MMAVFSWISFTLPIGFIHPPVVSCKWYNSTSKKFMLKEPNWDKAPSVIQIPYLPTSINSGRRKRSLHDDDFTPRMPRNVFDTHLPQHDYLTPDTVAELPRALPLAMKPKPGLTLAGNTGTRRLVIVLDIYSYIV